MERDDSIKPRSFAANFNRFTFEKWSGVVYYIVNQGPHPLHKSDLASSSYAMFQVRFRLVTFMIH